MAALLMVFLFTLILFVLGFLPILFSMSLAAFAVASVPSPAVEVLRVVPRSGSSPTAIAVIEI